MKLSQGRIDTSSTRPMRNEGPLPNNQQHHDTRAKAVCRAVTSSPTVPRRRRHAAGGWPRLCAIVYWDGAMQSQYREKWCAR